MNGYFSMLAHQTGLFIASQRGVSGVYTKAGGVALRDKASVSTHVDSAHAQAGAGDTQERFGRVQFRDKEAFRASVHWRVCFRGMDDDPGRMACL